MLSSQAYRLSFLTVAQQLKGNTMQVIPINKSKNRPHELLIHSLSELEPNQIALLLDCVIYATTETGYIDNSDLDKIKDALSHTLAMKVIYDEVNE